MSKVNGSFNAEATTVNGARYMWLESVFTCFFCSVRSGCVTSDGNALDWR